MRVTEVDVDDDAAFAAWHAPVVASDELVWPGEPSWLDVELRAIARRTDEGPSVLTAVLDDDGTAAGSAMLRLPSLEDRGTAQLLAVSVRPARRRHGVGTALVADAMARAVAAGRTTMVASSEARLGHEDPATSFASTVGFELAQATSRRRLELPVDESALAERWADAIGHAEGYEIETWTGDCPDRLLPGRLALAAGMSTDEPHGDLVREPQQWDEARLRSSEALADEMQRVRYAAGAVHKASGTLAGYSELGVSTIEPETGWQFDTIVVGPHRGHRLGMLVKVANLRALMAASPATRRLYTWNADVNRPMISVNESLGFQRVAAGSNWHRPIG